VSAHSWPFDQPRDCTVFTTHQIVDGTEPILHVTHDADDHGWQFLGRQAREEDAQNIALHEAVEIDSSVLQLADLPPGWHAWRNSAMAAKGWRATMLIGRWFQPS
jgi:hypothetical protein